MPWEIQVQILLFMTMLAWRNVLRIKNVFGIRYKDVETSELVRAGWPDVSLHFFPGIQSTLQWISRASFPAGLVGQ